MNARTYGYDRGIPRMYPKIPVSKFVEGASRWGHRDVVVSLEVEERKEDR